MTGIRYKIPMLSARAMLAFAKPLGEDVYSFNLNKAETTSVLLNHGETYQDDNAVFYQLMSMLHRDGFSPKEDELIIEDLYDVIIYLDFAGIFDQNAELPKNALRQKKAEAMFRPEGITLDLGNGPQKYLAFERSASMSRNAKLSFVRADLYDEITRRITLNLKIDICELSKLYAYNGLHCFAERKTLKAIESTWANKLIQFQYSVYNSRSSADFPLLFDTAIADALVLGPLRTESVELSDEVLQRIKAYGVDTKTERLMIALAEYYAANKEPDSEWVIIPRANISAYLGSASYVDNYEKKISEGFMEKKPEMGGVSAVRINI